jgi:transposase
MGKHFATLDTPIGGVTDDMGHIPSPRYLRRAQTQLTSAQRWLQRTETGSKRRGKALTRVQKLHGRVAARRETFHHRLVITLTERVGVLGGWRC